MSTGVIDRVETFCSTAQIWRLQIRVTEESRKLLLSVDWFWQERICFSCVFNGCLSFREVGWDLDNCGLSPIEWRIRQHALLNTFLDTVTEHPAIQETCIFWKLQVISFCSFLVFYLDTSEKSISVFRRLNCHTLQTKNTWVKGVSRQS